MEKNLYIDASHPNETRVVLKTNGNIEDYEYEGVKSNLIKNNIYLGKVSRVEPSLQAAFIDFGREKHGFLSFNDIQSDYYQIPQSDLEKIKKEEKKTREELLKKSKEQEDQNIHADNLIDVDPVEKKSNDAEIIENNKKQINYPSKRYKIQEVIKPNQVILVQVLKDERGFKGAALSTFISIAGKYIVLMPNTPKGGGISRKIFISSDRKKVRAILNQIEIPKEMGVIIRTAGLNKTKNEIEHDLNSLIKVWNSIKENAMNALAPSLIHQESEIIKRTLRDIFDEETQNVIIEGNEGYQKAKSFMKLMMPKHLKKIKKYRDKIPLFFKENIDEFKKYSSIQHKVKMNKSFESILELIQLINTENILISELAQFQYALIEFQKSNKQLENLKPSRFETAIRNAKNMILIRSVYLN